MSSLPTGTVTFLFTDIEGSTRLLHELGDAYVAALGEHRRLLREAFARHGGVEVDTQGDAFFVAFARASHAVAAAAEAQAALAGGPVRVRMGLHTGEPTLTDEGYVGMDVHKGARIAAAAHGGQVLLSQATRDLVEAEVRDLGEHRLNDVAGRERIFQLGDPVFPPLRTLNNSNLPLPPTRLVGRKEDLGDLLRLVTRKRARAVTITGPGGVGKTRLALEVAREGIGSFAHGVWFVDLSPVRDPQLVEPSISSTLGARVALAEHVGDRELLLVLDNFEQVVDAAPLLSSALRSCPRLQLLVTSREPLHLAGEREHPLRPIPEAPAVELFRQRADAVLPGFDGDYAQLAEICRRLDGLPLAIELAAARLKALDVGTLGARLEPRLPLLTGRSRDVPERQRTLRATIEWSYDLLDDDERRVFRALGVFAGGWTAEAADEVAGAELDVLESLVDKSLVRHLDGRYSMLETIREYAAARLDERPEYAEARDRHARYFGALAEHLDRNELEAFEVEHGNFRAALTWLGERGEAEAQLRLAAALAFFWRARGAVAEGRRRLERALASGAGDEELRGRGLSWAATLARRDGDYEAARRHAEERVALHEGSVDGAAAEAFIDLGVVLLEQDDVAGARPLLRRAAERAEAAGDAAVLYRARLNLGLMHVDAGEHAEAARELDAALELARRLETPVFVAFALVAVAQAHVARGDREAARAPLAEGLRLWRELASQEGIAESLATVATLVAASDRDRAVTLLAAAERLERSAGLAVAPPARAAREQLWARLRADLGDDRFQAAHARGAGMEARDAADLALAAVE